MGFYLETVLKNAPLDHVFNRFISLPWQFLRLMEFIVLTIFLKLSKRKICIFDMCLIKSIQYIASER